MKNLAAKLVLMGLVLFDLSEEKVFRVSKISCHTLDPAFCHFKTCNIVHREKGRAALYFNQVMNSNKPIDDIILNLGVFKISKNRRFQFINETLDFCAFSRQLILATGILGFAMSPILSISNLNLSCPLQQKNILFNGFPIDENTLKEIPVPYGTYMFQVRTAFMKSWKTDVKIYANRVERYS
ncbi:hypothetical protein KR018_009840 [Drosophila ironensis]|nr:hypothetical protein KR018_009840 [Drosophila ironensis]